jgi:hypothetical protein
MSENLHDEIDELAMEVEQTIAETEEYLENGPEFAPRNARQRRLRNKERAKR